MAVVGNPDEWPSSPTTRTCGLVSNSKGILRAKLVQDQETEVHQRHFLKIEGPRLLNCPETFCETLGILDGYRVVDSFKQKLQWQRAGVINPSLVSQLRERHYLTLLEMLELLRNSSCLLSLA